MMAGNTDIYEVIFKSTGIILGTLVAIYMLGKFFRVERSETTLFVTLLFGILDMFEFSR